MFKRKEVLCLALVSFISTCAFAQTSTSATSSAAPVPVAPVPNACPRPAAGSVIQQPPALFSAKGVLNVRFSYQTATDSFGRQEFCFMTPNGLVNPTLYVNPGDTLNITVTNNTPLSNVGQTDEVFDAPTCGDTTEAISANTNADGIGMTGGSMNIHYHGANVTPACHGDNVVKTLINSGSTFQYSFQFPTDEPPGLYWYHPHVHGITEAAVFGGASGALVVQGINNVQPTTAGLRQRLLMIRDLPLSDPNLEETDNTVDGGLAQFDLSVNFTPLNTTVTGGTATAPTVSYTPAVIYMNNGETQFWRVCNCTSDEPLDLQVRYDGVAQHIQIVGIDAVPVNSQDDTQPGTPISVTHYRIPPAGRVEFLVKAPASTVKVAQLVTQFIFSGPLGDTLPTRPLLNIRLTPIPAPAATVVAADDRVAAFTALNTSQQRFGGISSVAPTLTRTVFFEEVEDGSALFINASGCVTAAGAKCATQPYPIDTAFDSNNPPAIVTTQGTVEKWIVQNHARENHELHQHQIHFKVLSQDNFEANGSPQAPAINGQFLDMVEVPYCNGPAPLDGGIQPPACVDASGKPVIPYPQVQLLMDFRGPISGDFVFHCHILGHEDLGMMAIEHVNPAP